MEVIYQESIVGMELGWANPGSSQDSTEEGGPSQLLKFCLLSSPTVLLLEWESRWGPVCRKQAEALLGSLSNLWHTQDPSSTVLVVLLVFGLSWWWSFPGSKSPKLRVSPQEQL